MIIALIAAAAENNVIGRDNDLPWDLPDDLKFFRETTAEHPIIMGRKNYESIGRLLPKRTNIIVTRQPDYEVDGAIVCTSLDEALEEAEAAADDADLEEVFVIGGGELYRQALPLADRIYLTRIHADVDGDVYFPVVDWDDWTLESEVHHRADAMHEYDFTFQTWERC